jgi:hypothetical protein
VTNGYSRDSLIELLKNEYLTNDFSPKPKCVPTMKSPVEYPRKKDFLILTRDEQDQVIKSLYHNGPKGQMTSNEMATILKISKRKLDEIRKNTGTLKSDLLKDRQS